MLSVNWIEHRVQRTAYTLKGFFVAFNFRVCANNRNRYDWNRQNRFYRVLCASDRVEHSLWVCCVLITCVQLFGIPWTTRLLCLWDFPDKNTGMGCHVLLQGIFLTQGLNPHLLNLLHCRWILYHWTFREAPLSVGSEDYWAVLVFFFFFPAEKWSGQNWILNKLLMIFCQEWSEDTILQYLGHYTFW